VSTVANRLELLTRAMRRTAVRLDGWVNDLAGLGNARDKAMFTQVAPVRRLTDGQLRNLYRGDDMAAKIVDAKPDEALKKGYELHVQDEDRQWDEAEVKAQLADLDALKRVRQTWQRARLYGGAALIMGADDGQPLDQPLREDSIRALRWLQVVDRRHLQAIEVDEDPESNDFGNPTLFQVTIQPKATGAAGAAPQFLKVHASRMIVMRGVEVDEETDLEGWGDSVLQRAHEPLRQFQNAWLASSHLMTDMSQGVMVIDGLWEMIANSPELLEQRMQTVDRHRSASRMLLLNKSEDGDESFQRVATPLSGVPDMLLQHGHRLSAAAGTPITILMGISPPGGLNTAGEHEGEWWRDTVVALQEHEAKPALKRLVEVAMLAQEGPTGGQMPDQWDVRFPPLRQMSPEQESEMRLKIAQADGSYIDRGVLLAEEVALSRFGVDGWSMDTEIDREAREKLLELEQRHQLELAENPPTPPPGPPVPGEPDEDPDTEPDADDDPEE
jgi:uncharacterized protein